MLLLNTNYMALKIENILKSMIERIKIREEFLWLSGNGHIFQWPVPFS